MLSCSFIFAQDLNITLGDLSYYKEKLGYVSSYHESRLRRAEIIFLTTLPLSYTVVSAAYSGILYLEKSDSAMEPVDYLVSFGISMALSSVVWAVDSFHFRKYLREDAWKANVVRNLNSEGVSKWRKESTTGR